MADHEMVRLDVAGPSGEAVLALPAGDHITLAVHESGTYYESELLLALRERAKGGTFVDVGAHYGNHSVFFALECDADRLISIEPNPTTYAGLVENLRLNGLDDRARPLHLAIHPTWRRVDVNVPAWEPEGENAAKSNTGMARVAAAAEGQVDAAPLDEVLGGEDQVTLIKVDVEGGALGVIESGSQTIERHRPLLVVEALSDDEQDRLVGFLRPLGYEAAGPYSWTPTYIWAPA